MLYHPSRFLNELQNKRLNYLGDEVYPDGKHIDRIDFATYRDRWTGIVLKGIYRNNKVTVRRHKRQQQYTVGYWVLIFPRTQAEVRVANRKEGLQIIWEIREAMKDVLGNYFATVYSPDGRLRTFIANPNPVIRHHRGGNKLGAARSTLSSPVFLACL